VISLRDYQSLPYLVIATRSGMVKKSPLAEYDSNRSGGLIAIALKDGDEVISAATITDDDQLLLISEQGMSLRFTADDSSLRPMGRSTSGVIGMKFRKGDHLLSMVVISKEESERFLITATDGGFAKRTNLDEYRLQGRGGIGVKAAKIDESSRGLLVGALIVGKKDEILVITSGGSVMRTEVEEIRETGRDTMGVRLVDLDSETHVVSLTRVADSD
jgi:DNA gyrase subunit A